MENQFKTIRRHAQKVTSHLKFTRYLFTLSYKHHKSARALCVIIGFEVLLLSTSSATIIIVNKILFQNALST